MICREGVEVHYESVGSGQALLLTHGYSGTSEMWSAQVEAFAKTHHVITWDMRGHARSDSPFDAASYSETSCVEDMVAILDACGVTSAVIGGLALGGYLSLAFHCAHPERSTALVLVGTGPGYRNDDSRAAWNASAREIADSLDTTGLDALRAVVWGRHPLHRSAEGLALAARGMLQQDDAHILESLPGIAVPTLIVVGGDDTEFIAPSNYMARKIPDAQLVTIPDAGHGCNMERPAEFNAVLRSFLSSRASVSGRDG